MNEILKMKIDEFRDVCKKLGMDEFFDYQSDEYFWEALSSDSKTMYFKFKGYDFAVAKYVDKKAYVWHNGLYKVIDQQTPEMLEEQINLFHKNYKEYLIQNKIKDINKDFKDENNLAKFLTGEEPPAKLKDCSCKPGDDDFFKKLKELDND